MKQFKRHSDETTRKLADRHFFLRIIFLREFHLLLSHNNAFVEQVREYMFHYYEQGKSNKKLQYFKFVIQHTFLLFAFQRRNDCSFSTSSFNEHYYSLRKRPNYKTELNFTKTVRQGVTQYVFTIASIRQHTNRVKISLIQTRRVFTCSAYVFQVKSTDYALRMINYRVIDLHLLLGFSSFTGPR